MAGRADESAVPSMTAADDGGGTVPARGPAEGSEERTPRGPSKAEARRSEKDLGALFDAHAPFLVRVMTRMVGTRDRAEDVVQRAFLTAHRRGLPEGDLDRARGWLFRVAVNEARHERRSWARRRRLAEAVEAEPAEVAPSPEQGVEAGQQAQRVRELVTRLPDGQREVFVLYELEELQGSEIARMLGIPENTVWSRLRLARGRFERLWRARGEDA